MVEVNRHFKGAYCLNQIDYHPDEAGRYTSEMSDLLCYTPLYPRRFSSSYFLL
jgi:hypothetical protein